MNSVTHLEINKTFCGTPFDISEGFARVSMDCCSEMAADDRGLVHGGFIFGMADYAAMVAVNDPLVVLGSAETKFLKPVQVGDTVEAVARVQSESGKKRIVAVDVIRGEETVFTGTFTCFVLEKHVLD